MEFSWTNWTSYTTEPHIGLRSPNLTNTSVNLQENFEIDLEDTNWILTSSFIIFTMQTGKLITTDERLAKLLVTLFFNV